MTDIVIRYSGPFNQHTFSVNGDGDNLQISVVDFSRNEKRIIFTGDNFSQEEYEKRGGKDDEERYFSLLNVKIKKV